MFDRLRDVYLDDTCLEPIRWDVHPYSYDITLLREYERRNLNPAFNLARLFDKEHRTSSQAELKRFLTYWSKPSRLDTGHIFVRYYPSTQRYLER